MDLEEVAKQEILPLILNKMSMQYGFEKVLECVANSYNIPCSDLQKWAEKKQTEILQKILKNTTQFQKIEIEIETEKEIKKETNTGKKRKEEDKDKVRCKERHNLDEEEKIFNIASSKTENFYKRLDSIPLVKSRELLVKLYKNLDNELLKKEIIRTCGLEEIYELGLKEKSEKLRIEVIKAIHNRLKLRWIATENNENIQVRVEAIKKITDPHTLQKIILQDSEEIEIRKLAVNQIRSVSVLDMLRESISNTELEKHINDRMEILNGSDDYVKQSIETLIQTYH